MSWEKGKPQQSHLRVGLLILSVQTRKHDSNGHRGRLDIIADILEASHGGTRKTYLMYRCNMSFKQLKHYLDFLLRKELLDEINDVDLDLGIFRTTDKGKEFLKVYNGLKSLVR